MRQIRTVPLVAAMLFAGMAATASAALADAGVFSPGAPAPLSTLVRFEERDYTISYDQDVSLDPLSQATVTKIGYGRTTEVNIATTASGTYSSDGLTSPYIRYPGIVVEPVPQRGTFVAVRTGLGGVRGSSFVAITADPNGNFVVVDAGSRGFASCQLSGSFTYCASY